MFLITFLMFLFQLRTRTTEPKRRPQTIAVDMSELHQQTAHNYSIQTLNSTELAKERLRQVLAQVCVFIKSPLFVAQCFCVARNAEFTPSLYTITSSTQAKRRELRGMRHQSPNC